MSANILDYGTLHVLKDCTTVWMDCERHSLKGMKLTCGSENTCWMVLMGPQGTPVPSKCPSHLAVDSSENLREKERTNCDLTEDTKGRKCEAKGTK